MNHGILVHEPVDDVGVAVVDLHPGQTIRVATLEGKGAGTVTAIEDIPLGHKVALRDLPGGHKLQKYGRPIGETTQFIKQGSHVHSHNLKSQRWKI
jgi:(2R)-sulfolactate sulfo-lyase subunit alpha